MPNSEDWHDSINRMEDEHNAQMWAEKDEEAMTRFNVDKDCSHCEDVPTNAASVARNTRNNCSLESAR